MVSFVTKMFHTAEIVRMRCFTRPAWWTPNDNAENIALLNQIQHEIDVLSIGDQNTYITPLMIIDFNAYCSQIVRGWVTHDTLVTFLTDNPSG